MAADLDLLVLGDANPDLVLHGGDVVPAAVAGSTLLSRKVLGHRYQ